MQESRQAGFERVFREHGPALARVAASYAKPGSEHDDLAQDIALALWSALPKFRGESSEKTFVLRVAHNRALKHAFGRKLELEPSPEIVDPAPPLDQQLSERQDVGRLFHNIRRLPLSHREVLTLALEDMPHGEIGSILGISAGNVAVRLTRARKLLKNMFEEVQK